VRHTRTTWFVTALLLSVALVMTACGSDEGGGGSETDPTGGTASATGAVGDPSTDKLAQILARGTLVLSTDLEYPPQSFAVEGAERPTDTKCKPTELTGPEVDGYDVATGKLVAEALGVEPCFVTPSWTEVTSGNWNDRWDLTYESGAIDADRMAVLYMTQPYYSTPANFFVPVDSPAQEPEDLSGHTVGACTGCTMERYLLGTLNLPGPTIEFVVEDPEVVTFEYEVPGLKATARGEIEGFLCSEPVGAEMIADGSPLRMLPTPAYSSYKTGYVDKASGLDVAAFVAAVNEVVVGLHADGTLAQLSTEYFGKDYATAAGEFDVASLGQTVE
jgi:polar amino acid transport system substrate-binding protein